MIKMQKDLTTTKIDTNKLQENLRLQSKRVHLRKIITIITTTLSIVGFPQSEAQTMPKGQSAHIEWKTISKSSMSLFSEKAMLLWPMLPNILMSGPQA